MNLAALQNELGPLQTIAFTATADAATRADILSRLFRQQPQEPPQERPQVFVHGFDRPNLRLAMSARNHGRGQLAQFISGHRGDSGIVYCGSRRPAEEIGAFLRDEGAQALTNHAEREPAERSGNKDEFLEEK